MPLLAPADEGSVHNSSLMVAITRPAITLVDEAVADDFSFVSVDIVGQLVGSFDQVRLARTRVHSCTPAHSRAHSRKCTHVRAQSRALAHTRARASTPHITPTRTHASRLRPAQHTMHHTGEAQGGQPWLDQAQGGGADHQPCRRQALLLVSFRCGRGWAQGLSKR